MSTQGVESLSTNALWFKNEARRARRIDGQAHGAIEDAIALLATGNRSGWDFVIHGILELLRMDDLRPGVRRHFLKTCPGELIPEEFKNARCRMQDKILHVALDQAVENIDLWEETVKVMIKANIEGELRPGVRDRLIKLCPPDLLPPELKFKCEVGWTELQKVLNKSTNNGRTAAKAKKVARKANLHAAQPKKGSNGGGSDFKKGIKKH